ncbi:MAG: site-2 protease family protein [Verrucomicrobiota bacterium]
MRFKLFGVPVQVDLWFFLVMAMLGGGLSQPFDAPRVLAFVLAGFISVLFHEFGHALSGRRLGGGLPAVQLIAFGGLCIFPDARFTRSQRMLMTAAGPGAGFLLAGITFLVALALRQGNLLPPPGSFGSAFINAMLWINVVWSILNLLPIFPLDGGQLLRDILGPGKEKICRMVGLFLCIILAPLAFMNGFLIGAIMLLFLGYGNFKGSIGRTI